MMFDDDVEANALDGLYVLPPKWTPWFLWRKGNVGGPDSAEGTFESLTEALNHLGSLLEKGSTHNFGIHHWNTVVDASEDYRIETKDDLRNLAMAKPVFGISEAEARNRARAKLELEIHFATLRRFTDSPFNPVSFIGRSIKVITREDGSASFFPIDADFLNEALENCNAYWASKAEENAERQAALRLQNRA